MCGKLHGVIDCFCARKIIVELSPKVMLSRKFKRNDRLFLADNNTYQCIMMKIC